MSRRASMAAVLGIVTASSLLAPAVAAEVPSDVTPPTVVIEGRQFVVGARIDPAKLDDICPHTTAPVDVYWSGADEETGVAGYRVSSQAAPPDPDSWDVVVPRTTQTTYRTYGENSDCFPGEGLPTFYRVQARDGAGNIAEDVEAYGDISVYQENGRSTESGSIPVTTDGLWRTDKCTCYDAGRTTYSTAAGASITFTYDGWGGQWVALVMTMDIDRGELGISVDDGPIKVVDSYAPRRRTATVVWQHQFETAGTHTITVTNLGTDGRSRIDVDSILSTRDNRAPL